MKTRIMMAAACGLLAVAAHADKAVHFDESTRWVLGVQDDDTVDAADYAGLSDFVAFADDNDPDWLSVQGVETRYWFVDPVGPELRPMEPAEILARDTADADAANAADPGDGAIATVTASAQSLGDLDVVEWDDNPEPFHGPTFSINLNPAAPRLCVRKGADDGLSISVRAYLPVVNAGGGEWAVEVSKQPGGSGTWNAGKEVDRGIGPTFAGEISFMASADDCFRAQVIHLSGSTTALTLIDTARLQASVFGVR